MVYLQRVKLSFFVCSHGSWGRHHDAVAGTHIPGAPWSKTDWAGSVPLGCGRPHPTRTTTGSLKLHSVHGKPWWTDGTCQQIYCAFNFRRSIKAYKAKPEISKRQKVKYKHTIRSSNSLPDGVDWVEPGSLSPSVCLFLMSPLTKAERWVTCCLFQSKI